MRTKLASALLVMGLLASTMTPAHAILGLTKCEKVKKEIKHEESIGLLYFKDFSRQRKLLLKMSNPAKKNMADVLSWVSNVYASDTKVYAIVEKNAGCFSAEQVVNAREMNYQTSQSASQASYYVVMYARKYEPLTSSDFKLIKETYSGFYSFLNPKKVIAR
jgi:hypothetical protein